MAGVVNDALEKARHELESMHGLVACDGEAPQEKWDIDTTDVVIKLDRALAAAGLTKRIEAAFDEARKQRELMEYARWTVESAEHNAKQEHAEEWAGAKNNDVRAVMLAGWLVGDDEYNEAGDDFTNARLAYRLALLEIERLKLLVAAGAR